MQDDYEPEEYWSGRARESRGEVLRAVCVDKVPDIENRSAGALQARLLARSVAVPMPGNRALEFGCGAGRWRAFFTEREFEWFGVDISDDMLALAAERCPADRLAKTDGIHIPHPDASFDLVYSVTVLHHNTHENQDRILAEMMRVVKPGGALILYEDIDKGAERFNMFPRTIDGWIDAGVKVGARPVDHREVRYWPFRTLFYRLVGRDVGENNKDSPVRIAIGWMDYLLGGAVQGLIPRDNMLATAIVFRKD